MNPRQPDVVTVAVMRVDGGVTILRVITAEYRPSTPEEQAAGAGPRIANWMIDPTPAYIDAIIAKHQWPPPLQAVSWEFVPNEYVDESVDRTFRGAWIHRTGRGKPDVDMPKAREIHRQRLRRLRAPILEQLDTDYLRADEAGHAAEKVRIAQRKQQLRDVTVDPAIEAAQTPDELKNVLPEALRG